MRLAVGSCEVTKVPRAWHLLQWSPAASSGSSGISGWNLSVVQWLLMILMIWSCLDVFGVSNHLSLGRRSSCLCLVSDSSTTSILPTFEDAFEDASDADDEVIPQNIEGFNYFQSQSPATCRSALKRGRSTFVAYQDKSQSFGLQFRFKVQQWDTHNPTRTYQHILESRMT